VNNEFKSPNPPGIQNALTYLEYVNQLKERGKLSEEGERALNRHSRGNFDLYKWHLRSGDKDNSRKFNGGENETWKKYKKLLLERNNENNIN
jgi:hypothetical protein